MSQVRQGWAAFDKKQRQKQVNGTEFDNDPYPSLSSTASFMRNCDNVTRNNGLSTRPFSSVLLPSVDFPTLTENKDVCGDSDSRGKHGNKIIEENNHDLALKKLKGLYSWADNSLIEDIMAAVDDNIEMASTRLKEMVSSCSSEENKEAKTAELSSNIDDFLPDKRTEENLLLEMTVAFSDLSSTSEDNVKDNCRKLTDVYASDNAANLKHLPSIPVEPEWWEEDDVYLSHRKEAIKAMRSASQHSKAAQNAFFRGDHYSSQQHSLMAREERLIAERLNSKAAKEILSIRNSENDMWKLDLHGLHAAEAVQALQERLQRIEMQVPMNRSVSPNRLEAKNGMVRTPSLDLLSCMDMENVDKQQAPFRQRQTSLQVITGIGIHSRGQAALPAAIRSFLSENRYRFDELRPGVVTVRPKFRHR